MGNNILIYEIGEGVQAFTAGRDAVLPCHVIQPHQTHSVNVIRIDDPEITREQLEGVDALITDLQDVAIGVRTADCIPVLLYDPVRRAIGAAHSGWRGTVNMIAKKTIVEMVRLFGCSPSNIRAVIGPRVRQFPGRGGGGPCLQGVRISGLPYLGLQGSKGRELNGGRTSH